MIADYNTMPHMFWECNRLYFNHKLPTPKFDVMHTYRKLGKFAYRWGEKKKPFKKRFMVMAQKLNEQYGLNITMTYDVSPLPLAPNAPR